MIYFYDIFELVISIFDDPDLSSKYYNDRAGFQSDMLDFLMVGKDKFTYPTAITDKLVEMDGPEGNLIVVSGEEGTSFDLSDQASALPTAELYNTGKLGVTVAVDGKPVYATYDPESYTLVLDEAITASQTLTFKWFYAGAFTADFSKCFRSDYPIQPIMQKITAILAYATLSAWGDKEVGRVIEVRNILTDHDFKMYSPANSARAKMEWRNQMNRDMDTLVSELNWRIMSTPKGGSRFGQ